MISIRDEIGTPLTDSAVKILLLGSGELGKEITIEAQRLGVEVIAVDRYPNAPAMQVAHKSYVGNMKDKDFLWSIVEREKPDAIVPEIEAINLDALFEIEKEGYFVVPNAKATWIAMHRERTRETLAKEAKVPTSRYAYATTLDELYDACEKIGYPCHTKAIMSSSGKGSYFVKGPEDVPKAWEVAKKKARGSADKIIVEEHIDFDVEITELAVRHFDENGKIVTTFPKPVGHYQIEGDYHSSWQPAEISEKAEREVYRIAKRITDALGGLGIFGVEMFVKGDKVWANEVSPRPHDTGMVTMASHPTGFSEFGLHVRAVLGLPIPAIEENGTRKFPILTSAATHVILSNQEGYAPKFRNIFKGLNVPNTTIRLFGKPEAYKGRRLGVALAWDKDVQVAKRKAERVAHMIELRTRSGEWQSQDYEKRKHLL
ncbi:phosphoribosylglycinamide formyltransferase 2 [Thermococcus alcaliphilus]|uniref:phosphoribosylglycinamide formyltransferase 2 n=1 Tax=Thermococcus alcaliphilus TaxID=139207 RepID=UPI002090281E|nr:phosphoribosylglycinamide formyltransferase 2 [Thermococcus alcaliphilus]MCO6041864.1 phosphoribosylglycinamide formyltransferase 2 [Thermococcus alcaliphilus]